MEALFENPQITILEKDEMEEITGGWHYEWIDGELVYVLD